MQLPFLAAPRCRDAAIVPLVMGYQTARDGAASSATRSAAALARPATRCSSPARDLSHYHDARDGRAASTRVVIDSCRRLRCRTACRRALDAQPEHACGGGPMVAVMRAARALGARDAACLNYADSGDVSGDKSAVVGYLAAALGNRRSR